ncbi:MAG: YhcH/YjgK/YiaL family protein [Tepidisphaeraceae bacterium]
MILDRLDRCDLYRNLGERFAAGFDYLRSTDLTALPDGRYDIRGHEVVAIVATYSTRPLEQGRWEAHRNHADIQYLIRGRERIGIAPLAPALKLLPPYDPEKDVEFYAPGDRLASQLVTVEQGDFALFLPHDVHNPNLLIDSPAEVKKVVIKVRLE